MGVVEEWRWIFGEERKGEERKRLQKGGGSRKNAIVNGFFGFHLRIFEEVVG